MTDQYRSLHAQVAHTGTYQREAMLRVARGARVNKQTIASLTARGWIRHQDYKSIELTDDGTVALRIIREDFQ